MKKENTRRYHMTTRAESAARTAREILAATVELWRERALDEITLQEIADRAGVSTQTVIRRFGSKDGLIEACIESDAAGVRGERARAPEGDVEQALEILMSHYERDGDAILRTLGVEDRLDAARKVAETGRQEHRAWCARVFERFLPPPDADEHHRRLDAFVAVTDLYLWKLLRRDMDRTPDEAKRTLRTLLDGLILLSTREAEPK